MIFITKEQINICISFIFPIFIISRYGLLRKSLHLVLLLSFSIFLCYSEKLYFQIPNHGIVILYSTYLFRATINAETCTEQLLFHKIKSRFSYLPGMKTCSLKIMPIPQKRILNSSTLLSHMYAFSYLHLLHHNSLPPKGFCHYSLTMPPGIFFP